ncbi:hypothetical protein KKG58_01960 [Patescibacteria group bacterium]|nr:hypothetical protein [Patescibacteria group bacterium]
MWINKLKDLILNTLFPVECLGCRQHEEIICQKCLDKIIVLNKWETNLYSLERIVTIFDYQQPLIKKAIKSFKYSPYNLNILKSLSPIFIKCLKQSPLILKFLTKNRFILVPIPLSKQKLAKRGFNQAEVIAQELAAAFNWPFKKSLKKIKNTPSQTNLSREQRKLNVQSVFKIQGEIAPNIILIDDILTTGATLEQAAKALYYAGAKKIWGIVLVKG